MKRSASARWQGTGLEGKGALNTKSGVFNEQPYSFKTRFENEDHTLGTNPEELIAAAHAGCYAMALSFALNGAGYTADTLDCKAIVSLEKDGDGFSIPDIKLIMDAKIPNISEEEFQALAKGAKEGCPISKALAAVNIELKATLNK